MPTIREIMQSDLITVEPKTPVRDAISLLIEHGISGLPVVDDQKRIVGVLSEKDILKVFYEGEQEVGALMTADPECVSVDDPLVDVIDMLMANNFRRVLVHEQGKLVGLVSRADLMPALFEGLLERSSLTPPIDR